MGRMLTCMIDYTVDKLYQAPINLYIHTLRLLVFSVKINVVKISSFTSNMRKKQAMVFPKKYIKSIYYKVTQTIKHWNICL